jgi:hypothetical protein
MTIPALTTPLKWLAVAAGCLAVAYLAFAARGCAKQHTATAQTQIADQHAQQAAIAAAQGATHDQELTAEKAQREAAESKVARLNAELAKLRFAHVSVPADPGTPDPQPIPANTDLVAVVAKQDEVIKAYVEEVASLKAENSTLVLSRDSWKLAYDEKSKEAVAIRIALEAQVAANKAERWKGRFEGFAFGIGAGYAGAKL